MEKRKIITGLIMFSMGLLIIFGMTNSTAETTAFWDFKVGDTLNYSLDNEGYFSGTSNRNSGELSIVIINSTISSQVYYNLTFENYGKEDDYVHGTWIGYSQYTSTNSVGSRWTFSPEPGYQSWPGVWVGELAQVIFIPIGDNEELNATYNQPITYQYDNMTIENGKITISQDDVSGHHGLTEISYNSNGLLVSLDIYNAENKLEFNVQLTNGIAGYPIGLIILVSLGLTSIAISRVARSIRKKEHC